MSTQTKAMKLARLAINNLIASSHATDPQPWRDARQDAADALTAIDKALAEQPAPVQVPFLVRLYNEGYHAGHHHTVEGYYTHVVPQELDTYHSDLVAEWLADNPQAQPAPEIAIADAYRAGVDSGIAAEREACAKVCDDWAKTSYLSEAKSCAKIIRARGSNT